MNEKHLDCTYIYFEIFLHELLDIFIELFQLSKVIIQRHLVHEQRVLHLNHQTKSKQTNIIDYTFENGYITTITTYRFRIQLAQFADFTLI